MEKQEGEKRSIGWYFCAEKKAMKQNRIAGIWERRIMVADTDGITFQRVN